MPDVEALARTRELLGVALSFPCLRMFLPLLLVSAVVWCGCRKQSAWGPRQVGVAAADIGQKRIQFGFPSCALNTHGWRDGDNPADFSATLHAPRLAAVYRICIFEQANLAFELDLLVQPACSVQILAGSSKPIEAPSIVSFAGGRKGPASVNSITLRRLEGVSSNPYVTAMAMVTLTR